MTQQPAQVHPLALILRLLAVVALFGVCGGAQAQSLFFTSNFTPDDVGRVEIQVDGRPIDVGAGEFTLEFWMRASSGNSRGAGCNTSDYTWINGNIVFDRDRLDAGARDFGLAIANGRIAFGVQNANGSYTICSDNTVLNDDWRHIAVQRRASDGRLWVHVDGILEQEAVGPVGDISYPNGQNGGTLQPVLTIGREKYGFDYGYTGWLDEIRISNVLRYQSSNFQVPTQPYVLDASTVALYHLDENAGNVITDDNSGLSNGERQFSAAAGPDWSIESPFGASSSPGTMRFSAGTYSANEGTATVTITVTRASGNAGAATVDLGVTGGTATSGADYQFTPSTLSWNADQGGSLTRDITIVDDTITEGSETINLALSNATGASIGSQGTAVVTIAASDSTAPPAAGVLQFSAATYTVSEATSTLAITVTRTGGSSGAASVNVAANGGTATASADYQIPSTSLTWNDGEATSRTLNITIVNDTAVEGSETITLGLSNVTGAGLGAVASATATINDDDQSTPTPPAPPAPPAAPRSSGGGGAADSLWILFSMYALLRHRNRRRSARNAGGCSVL